MTMPVAVRRAIRREQPAGRDDGRRHMAAGRRSVLRIRLFFDCSSVVPATRRGQAEGDGVKVMRHVGSGSTIRSAVSPWSFAHEAKKAARRCDTIRASLQVHPATRQARRAARSVAREMGSVCWSITLRFSVSLWPETLGPLMIGR
jgi:hypothetical protein